ncbi:RNA-directed DNA polymerase [Psychrobium sp. MM17-31]|uniref:antiviral reverse transcriptase Drt3a n=1 Tax=Psychrobium sp. MM17-31 TaxID=2917758 RepID=UPI001EF443E8|nr:antiviral reverse transcriptase Drt3a [Psychrobium sp. MM17-31]MCG7531773.1 RNA-directed DNA polymerase [Psychrobium sp. MM17-31]
MLNQSISIKNLKLIKGRTFQKFHRGDESDRMYNRVYATINDKLTDSSYKFDNFISKKVGKKHGFDCASAEDELVLKKLNDNIKRLFKVKTSDRHAIVKQAISLLKDSQPISVVRLDIKNFYEEIDRKKIVKLIQEEYLLSHQSRIILKSFDEESSIRNLTGLPRGISLSATLSEIGLRNFDSKARKLKGVYYYARYVDDMIIFCTCNPTELVESLSKLLSDLDLNLEFNEKTYLYDPNISANPPKPIDYLGYKISFKSVTSESLPRDVSVEISEKKINKIKTRLHKAFRSYNRTRTFDLLESRIKFLTGNQYIIGDVERTKLKSGIYYNYPLITTYHQIKELDRFYQSLFVSKCPHIVKALAMLRNHNDSSCNKKYGRLERLQRMSFKFGFENRVMNKFSRKMSRKIKGCW